MRNTLSKNILTVALATLPVLAGGALMGCSTGHKQESTGQYFDSSVITAKVKANLYADKYVSGLPITVKTYKNVVQLSGFVNTRAQRDRAIEIARQTEGVIEVWDALLIKKR